MPAAAVTNEVNFILMDMCFRESEDDNEEMLKVKEVKG